MNRELVIDAACLHDCELFISEVKLVLSTSRVVGRQIKSNLLVRNLSSGLDPQDINMTRDNVTI